MRRVSRFTSVVIAMAMGLPACGGDTGPSTSGATDGGVLEFFGDLAVPLGKPTTISVDAAGGTAPIGAGAVMAVPASAFGEPTTVTTSVFDLAFDLHATNAPESTAYVISTEGPVSLATPVVLEVSVPSDSVTVQQLVAGEWSAVEVAPGPTTRVPITHFSDVVTVVTAKTDASPEIVSPAPDGDVPGDFLLACIVAVNAILGNQFGTNFDGLSAHLSLALCTRALIDRYSPLGVRVDEGCVGGQMTDGADLQTAIDACAAASTTTSASEESPPSDGASTGSVRPTAEAASLATVHDSSVVAVVADGTVSIAISVTFEAIWVAGDATNEPCVSTERWVMSGSAPAGPTFEIPLQMDDYELIAISGCEQSTDDDDDEAIPFTGTIDGNTINGMIARLFEVTATLG